MLGENANSARPEMPMFSEAPRERRFGPASESNFQLRVRKGFPSADNNFQLRVRKGFPSADNNFQLRVRKRSSDR